MMCAGLDTCVANTRSFERARIVDATCDERANPETSQYAIDHLPQFAPVVFLLAPQTAYALEALQIRRAARSSRGAELIYSTSFCSLR